MFDNPTLMLAAGAMIASLVLLAGLLLGSGHSVRGRLADVAGANRHASRSSAQKPHLSSVGQMLMPTDESKVRRVQQKLMQAGVYQRHGPTAYYGARFVLFILPLLVGIALTMAGMMTLLQGLLFGGLVSVFSNLLPSVWLTRLKKNRQTNIRRALPDALDVIVICLDGGLSLPAAFARVANELKTAHPLLASELAILQREMQLGRSTGEALRDFSDRFDVDELRSLASVVVQAERFGASVVQVLKVHAESLRMRRYQYAEAQAHKAPVKMIFPTVLLIFPALYIVLMGPAGIKLAEMLRNLGN